MQSNSANSIARNIIEVVNGADHFLAGRTEKVADLVTAFAATLP